MLIPGGMGKNVGREIVFECREMKYARFLRARPIGCRSQTYLAFDPSLRTGVVSSRPYLILLQEYHFIFST